MSSVSATGVAFKKVGSEGRKWMRRGGKKKNEYVEALSLSKLRALSN